MYIPTSNTGQLNPPFHTFAEFRLIVNRVVAWQSTDWLAANVQFSPNAELNEKFGLIVWIRKHIEYTRQSSCVNARGIPYTM